MNFKTNLPPIENQFTCLLCRCHNFRDKIFLEKVHTLMLASIKFIWVSKVTYLMISTQPPKWVSGYLKTRNNKTVIKFLGRSSICRLSAMFTPAYLIEDSTCQKPVRYQTPCNWKISVFLPFKFCA